MTFRRPASPVANNLDAFFMPFTANRQFQEEPTHAGQGQGRSLLDAGRPQESIDGTRRSAVRDPGHGRPASSSDALGLASMRGFFLNCRFAVNGMKKASRLVGDGLAGRRSQALPSENVVPLPYLSLVHVDHHAAAYLSF